MEEKQHDPVALATEHPTPAELKKELDKSQPLNSLSLKAIDDIRFCRWPGQTADGKKRDTKETPAFPWNGASDSRQFTVDGAITFLAALDVTSFRRAMVKPKAADDQVGSYAAHLADYFINELMVKHLAMEVPLSAQYFQSYGWCILHPTWEQRTSLKRRKLSLDELQMFAQQVAPNVPDYDLNQVGLLVMDPLQEATAVAVVTALWGLYAKMEFEKSAGNATELELPELSAKTARKVVRELRETGFAEARVPYVCENGPRIYALRPWDEVWLSNSTTEIKAARLIHQAEWLSESELRARGRDEHWNADWIERVAQQKGKTGSQNLPVNNSGGRLLQGGSGPVSVSAHNHSDEADDELIQIFHAVYRAVDEDGIPGIYCCTYHAHVLQDDNGGELYAKRELLDFPHGEYPYVALQREVLMRRVTASRGVPEIVVTAQREEKALWDALIDRTSITTMPPVNIPVGSNPLKLKYKFSPAGENEVYPGKEPSFMQMPNSGGFRESAEMMDRVGRKVSILVPISHPQVPPDHTQTLREMDVSQFLLGWSDAIQQIVSLAQKYMPDAEFARITGAPAGWLTQNRDSSGILAAELRFDVRDLDPELVWKRLEALNKLVIPIDDNGVLNRDGMVKIAVRSINPSWERELVLPSSKASDQLYDRVLSDLMGMWQGVESRYAKDDPTAGAKLQIVQQIVAANPIYQEGLKAGGRFAELLQNYVKHLQFASQQQGQNKTYGRLGVAPVGPTPGGAQ